VIVHAALPVAPQGPLACCFRRDIQPLADLGIGEPFGHIERPPIRSNKQKCEAHC
jgi:hypothetical protein